MGKRTNRLDRAPPGLALTAPSGLLALLGPTVPSGPALSSPKRQVEGAAYNRLEPAEGVWLPPLSSRAKPRACPATLPTVIPSEVESLPCDPPNCHPKRSREPALSYAEGPAPRLSQLSSRAKSRDLRRHVGRQAFSPQVASLLMP